MKHFLSILLTLTFIQCKNTPKAAPEHQVFKEVYEFTGIVQSSGLSEEEKTKLELTDSRFQISSDGEFFFIQSEIDFEAYWGKCVSLVASINRTAADNRNGFAYNRGTINVEDISQFDYEVCHEQFELNTSQMKSAMNDVHGSTGKAQKMAGIIKRNLRPSPDVAYDYRFILTEPIKDFIDASGVPKLQKEITILPIDFKMQHNFESAIKRNKEVTLSCYQMGGYVESTVFYVTDIK